MDQDESTQFAREYTRHWAETETMDVDGVKIVRDRQLAHANQDDAA